MSDKPVPLDDQDPYRTPLLPAVPTGPAEPVQGEWADYGEGSPGGGLSLGRVVLAIRRYWWLVLVMVLLGAGGGYGAYSLIAPIYTAQAQILVSTQSREELATGAVQAEALMDESSLLDLLRTRLVLQPVVEAERQYLSFPDEAGALFDNFSLADSVAFGSTTLQVSADGATWSLSHRGQVVEEGALGQPVGAMLGYIWEPDTVLLRELQEPLEFTVLPPPDAAGRLGQELTASLNRQGNFIYVSLDDENPVRAARVLNAVIARFSQVAEDLKEEELQGSLSDLERQVAANRDSVAVAQQRLEQFRVATITEPTDRSTPVAGGTQETRAPIISRYQDLRDEVDDLSLEKSRIGSILAQIPDSGVPIPQLELIPAVSQASEIMAALDELAVARTARRQLLQQFTPEYPAVRRETDRIASLENEVVPDLLRSLMAALDARERDLRSRTDSVAVELREIPERMIQENALRLKLAEFEALDAELGRRVQLRRLAFQSSLADFQVLNEATVPFVPSSDQRLPMAGAVFLGFLGLGLAGAVLLDRFDSRFRYPEDLTGNLGVEVLGMIPRIKGKKTQGEVEEAFRDLRMRLMYAHGTAGPLRVVLTSPGPGEGKTLVAANLGLAFAKIGRRTLLIDGDTRRGDLHRIIGGERTPGLVDFLAGTSDGQIISLTEYPNLHFMGSGARLARAPELLAGERIKHLFHRLRDRYDVIIVDGPPMAVGADAFHLASLCGSMALVARAGKSEKAIVERKLQALQGLPVRVLGGILNDVASSALKGYGYYSYYVPGYEAGGEGEEPDPMAALPPADSSDIEIPD
jgi:capsular exopolysaccharide synthesis family protein